MSKLYLVKHMKNGLVSVVFEVVKYRKEAQVLTLKGQYSEFDTRASLERIKELGYKLTNKRPADSEIFNGYR